MNHFKGHCHCGNLEITLETNLPLSSLPLRRCTCSFCSRHGARSTSDPDGRIHFSARDPNALWRYRFGLHTTDFLICRTCGVYIGALTVEGDAAFAIVNANVLDQSDELVQPATPMRYDGEDEAARRDRRRARWSPVTGTY
jgi:hypothetical protein